MVGRASDHQKVVVSENEDIAHGKDVTQFHTIQGEDFTVLEVICKKLGETDVKLMISNNPTSSNCQGQTSSVTTRVSIFISRGFQIKIYIVCNKRETLQDNET